jgi:signal transduction histidine kinase
MAAGIVGSAVWNSGAILALVAVPVLVAALCVLRRRLQDETAAKLRERHRREEMEAYERIAPNLAPHLASGIGAALKPVEAMREMAKLVCRTIADKSVFPSAALLLKNAEGRFYCAGSCGVDDLTVVALLAWGEQVVMEERGGVDLTGGPPLTGPSRIHGARSRTGSFEAAKAGARAMAARTPSPPVKSFTIPLAAWNSFDPETSKRRVEGKRERRRWRRSIVTPLRTPDGRLMGTLAVFADDSATGQEERLRNSHGAGGRERATGPIEALATRLATAIESAALADRLLRAEKLAGLGQLAGGVAHALNNPLTAVLGFAELIEETSSDPRVRRDARTILAEARKMKDTVQSLLNFWRPVTLSDEPVQMATVVRELTDAFAETLAERGVQLIVAGLGDLPPVRGCRERLRQMLEHLLNNAAQAIATLAGETDHAIRVTASHDTNSVNLIVSDTGPGFREPGRVFDPFYTTRQPGEGSGLGLSICYGIVREHGGEISAFNLHPHGAAVVVELPLRSLLAADVEDRVMVPAGAEV